MPFQIIRNDITKVHADAIVNTANPEPTYAAGTDSAIYAAAGADDLLAERQKIGRIHPGEVAVTPAFALCAKFIIHTVGPSWQGGDHGEYDTLASCYRKSLLIARQLGCGSIAFPLISTGVYGFPKDRALEIALNTVSSFLQDNEMQVTLVVFDKKAFELSSDLTRDVQQYIDEKYVEQRRSEEYGDRYEAAHTRRRQYFPGMAPAQNSLQAGSLPEAGGHPETDTDTEDRYYEAESEKARSSMAAGREDRGSLLRDILPRPRRDTGRPPAEDAVLLPAENIPSPEEVAEGSSLYSSAAAPRSLSDLMSHVGESFQERLLRMIDERGFTDTEVYKRANLDRKLFSKIRCNTAYTPKKKTALALAIALELNLDETLDLLRRAGYAFSPSSKFDLIVQYSIENRNYDIYEINATLFDYDQPMLGS